MIRTAAALSTFRSENNVISTSSANQPWLKRQQNRSSASKGVNPLVPSMIITMTLRAQEQLNQKWLIMSTAGRSAVSQAWNSVEDSECLFWGSQRSHFVFRNSAKDFLLLYISFRPAMPYISKVRKLALEELLWQSPLLERPWRQASKMPTDEGRHYQPNCSEQSSTRTLCFWGQVVLWAGLW